MTSTTPATSTIDKYLALIGEIVQIEQSLAGNPPKDVTGYLATFSQLSDLWSQVKSLIGSSTVTAADLEAPHVRDQMVWTDLRPAPPPPPPPAPVPAAVAFILTMPANVVAGVPVTIEVLAVDAGNGQVGSYAGKVHFSSSDPGATLPSDSPLVSGFGTFTVTFKTAGTHTITVSDGALSVASSVVVTAAVGTTPPPTGDVPYNPATDLPSGKLDWNPLNDQARAKADGWPSGSGVFFSASANYYKLYSPAWLSVGFPKPDGITLIGTLA